MARYYFEIKSGGDYPIYDRHTQEHVGTLHDVIVAERVVHLLNKEEEKHDGR